MQTKVRAVRSNGSGQQVDLKVSRDGDLRIAQYLPEYTMLAAAGKIFAADTTGGTSAIPVVAAPTNSPEWGLYNANVQGGPHLVILKVSTTVESGLSGLGLSLFICSAIGAQTVVAANASGCVIRNLGGSLSLPNAFITSNPTLLGTQASWIIAEAADQINSDGVGSGVVADIDGYIIVPPKGICGLEVVAETGTTVKYDLSFIFAEVQLDT